MLCGFRCFIYHCGNSLGGCGYINLRVNRERYEILIYCRPVDYILVPFVRSQLNL